jgi:sigma-B regulation protein RsbU (phosphoserine phosphatase)
LSGCLSNSAQEARADPFSALAEVSRAVASILDLDTLLDRVVTLIHRQFGYPFVHLYIVDTMQQQIVYRAGSGSRSEFFRERGLSYALDDPNGIIPWVARNSSTVVANDVEADPRYRAAAVPETAEHFPSVPSTLRVPQSRAPQAQAPDTCAELTVPLVFGDRVLGVLDVQSDRRDAFGEDDRRLYQEAQEQALLSTVMLQVAETSQSQGDLGQVLETVVELALQLTSANRCAI